MKILRITVLLQNSTLTKQAYQRRYVKLLNEMTAVKLCEDFNIFGGCFIKLVICDLN